MIANRVVMILIAAVCLAALYLCFKTTIRSNIPKQSQTLLSLSTNKERIYYSDDWWPVKAECQQENAISSDVKTVALPDVTRTLGGWRNNLKQLITATLMEFACLARSAVWS